MTEPSRLFEVAALRPIVLDAAMGTRLIARGLSLVDDDPCLWNLTRPDAVAEVHALDLAAGAGAVLTNTFGANPLWLARFGRDADFWTINRRSVEIARLAAGPGRFVIGTIGPTAAAHARAQAETLAESGVDALVFETHRIDQAEAALRSVRPVVDLPLIVSLWSWPEPLESSTRILEDLGASAIGGNCQSGTSAALELARSLRPSTRLPLWIKPSAGLPGDPPEAPESFAAAAPDLLRLGVRFLGGCCGTTEAHVAALRTACYDDRFGETYGPEG